MQRLERSFNIIYKRFKCWGEIHSIERFQERWKIIQRLFFSSSSSNHNISSKHYVIFSHGNLLSSIINFLMSGASWNRWHFDNIAPHCSVSVLSYKSGDLLPEIVLKPFQILNQSLPKTINNVNPKNMRLKEMITTGIINEQIWKLIINEIIPVSKLFYRKK
jgi:broad specificity phosphatase PhoE